MNLAFALVHGVVATVLWSELEASNMRARMRSVERSRLIAAESRLCVKMVGLEMNLGGGFKKATGGLTLRRSSDCEPACGCSSHIRLSAWLSGEV